MSNLAWLRQVPRCAASIANVVKEQCAKCGTEVRERLGFESPTNEALCGSCYFAVWGPSGAAEIARAAELLTPAEPPRRWRGLA